MEGKSLTGGRWRSRDGLFHQRMDRLGGLRAAGDPMLDSVHFQVNQWGIGCRAVMSDDFNKTSIPILPPLHDYNSIEGLFLSAHAR